MTDTTCPLGRWRQGAGEDVMELDWDLTAKARDVLRKSATGYENAHISLTPLEQHRLQAGSSRQTSGGKTPG